MMFRLSKSRNGLSTKAATPVYSTLAIDLQNSELDALLAVRSLVLVVQLSRAFQIQFMILNHCVLISAIGILETDM